MLTGVDSIAFSDQTLLLNEHLATGAVAIAGAAREGRLLSASATNVADVDGVGSLRTSGSATTTRSPGPLPPSIRLPPRTSHPCSVCARFVDGLGNTESLWSSPTTAILPAEHTPPTVREFSPTDEAQGVARDASIVLTFSEAIARGMGSVRLTTLDGALVESFSVATSDRISVSGNSLVVEPTAALEYATDYRLEFTAGNVLDLA